MNTLAAFTFSPTGGESVTLRAVQIDGNPWFVAADVCRALGLKPHKQNRSFQTHLDRLPAGSRRIVTGVDATVPNRRFSAVSESGLYRLVLRSDKPQAGPFQSWVTEVVLPAIRKDGAYVMGEEKVATGEMSEDEFVLKAVAILQKKVERLAAERDAAVKQAEALAPKAAIVDAAFGERLPTLHAFARIRRSGR